MPNSETPATTPAGSNSTGGVDITQLYAVIGAKEVMICQLNGALAEFRSVQAELAAVKRQCETLQAQIDEMCLDNLPPAPGRHSG